MHGLEFIGVALVLLFYILRAIFRGLRWLFRGLRRALGLTPPGARPVPQSVQRGPAPPAAGVPPPPKPWQPPQPPAPPRFAPEQTVPPSPLPSRPRPVPQPTATPDTDAVGKITLRPDGKDLVRALIWQEILSPPRSQRSRRLP